MSEPGLGDVAFLGFGEEGDTTWGTAVSRTKFLRIMSDSLRLHGGFNFPDIGSFGAAQRAAIKQPAYVDGTVELEVNYEGFGLMLKYLLGSLSSSEPLHTATPADDLRSLTLEIDRDKTAAVYSGAKINSAAFSQARGEVLKCVLSFVAKDETDDTATAETFPTDSPVLDDHFQGMEMDDTGVSITEWSMEINNGLSSGDRSNLGSLAIKEPVRMSKRTITGSFTAEFDNTVAYSKFTARAAGKLEFLYTDTESTDIDTSSTTVQQRQLNFIMPTVRYTEGARPVSGIGPIIQSFNYQAIYNTTGSAAAISIQLQNAETGIASS